MARLFNGTTDKARTTSLPTTATDNFTLFAWAFPVSYVSSYLVENGYDGGGSGVGYSIAINASGEARGNMGFVVGIASGIFLPKSIWSRIAVVRRSGTCWVVCNGKIGNTRVTNTPFSPAQSYHVGYREDNASGIVSVLNAVVAHSAIWDRALNDAELMALTTGRKLPLDFRAALKHYSPLNSPDTGPELDLITVNNLTLTGTKIWTQPQVISFSRIKHQLDSPAVAAGQPLIMRTQTVPYLAGSLRQRRF